MENKNIEDCEIQSKATIRFSPSEEKEYYVGLRSQLIKILYLIEDEKAGKGSAELYIYGFMYELKSANVLCNNKLIKICVKMHGLCHDFGYKNMAHEEIKRQIFECRGIVDHLIKELS